MYSKKPYYRQEGYSMSSQFSKFSFSDWSTSNFFFFGWNKVLVSAISWQLARQNNFWYVIICFLQLYIRYKRRRFNISIVQYLLHFSWISQFSSFLYVSYKLFLYLHLIHLTLSQAHLYLLTNQVTYWFQQMVNSQQGFFQLGTTLFAFPYGWQGPQFPPLFGWQTETTLLMEKVQSFQFWTKENLF